MVQSGSSCWKCPGQVGRDLRGSRRKGSAPGSTFRPAPRGQGNLGVDRALAANVIPVMPSCREQDDKS